MLVVWSLATFSWPLVVGCVASLNDRLFSLVDGSDPDFHQDDSVAIVRLNDRLVSSKNIEL